MLKITVDLNISLAEILTIAGALVAFSIALWQYRRGQRWKRKEFILNYQNSVMSDFDFKRGCLVLDWNRIDIPLKAGEIDDRSCFWFNDDKLQTALRIHYDMTDEEGFSAEETVIRFVIDDCFEKLGRFYPFIKNGLIRKEDLSGDVNYWLDIIGNPANRAKDDATRRLLWNYIVEYRFTNLEKLCACFGYDIRSRLPG